MGEDDSPSLIPKLVICLIAAASAAVVVTIYHCITTGHIRALLRVGRRVNNPTNNRSFTQRLEQMQQSSVESSLADLIPSHKYQKGSGLFADQDGICPVCLSEFEEGEELRTLPECMHSYHVACIDMWLYSHSNCPMCRTNAAPSPQMLMHLLENSNSETPPPPETPPPAMQRQQANLNV